MCTTNAVPSALGISNTVADTTCLMPIRFSGDGQGDMWLVCGNSYAAFLTLDRPIKIGGGSTVSVGPFCNPPESYYYVEACIQGLLVDPSDLYAAIGNRIEQFATSGPDLAAVLRLDTPRPAVVTMESAGELAGTWTPRLGALIEPGSNPALRRATFEPAGAREFLRVKARPR